MLSIPGHFRFALALLCFALPASAATITVNKTNGQTIQGAIDSAASGDTILVGPGTYFEHIDFKGKNILVTSTLSTDAATIAAATAATILDGSSTGPVITSSADSSPDASTNFLGLTLTYFTIQHGGSPTPGLSAASYGGVYVPHGSVSLMGNIITHNNFGGISVTGGDYILASSNTITENTCWGIVIVGGGIDASDNEISATQTPATGCTITDFRGTVSTNSSGILIDGGGIPGVPGTSDIRGNTIEDNNQVFTPGAPAEGGAAIAIYSGGARIHSNIIRRNSAPFARGGAIDMAAGSIAFPAFPPTDTVSIVQNLIYQNQAGCGGAAMAFYSGGLDTSFHFDYSFSAYTLLVANNTIADNTIVAAAGCPTGSQSNTQVEASEQGLASPDVLFVNNVISGDVSTLITDCHQQAVPSLDDQAVFDHNLLYSGGGAIFGKSCLDESVAPLDNFFGNIVANPQFVNASIGDYRLASSSPGIDAGNNGMVLTVDTMYDNGAYNNGPLPILSSGTPGELADLADLSRNLRVQDATGKVDGTGQESDVIDIGAYELPGTRVQDNPLSLILSTIGLPTNPGPATLTAYIRAGESTANPNGVEQAIVPSGTITFFVDGVQAGDAAPIATTQSPILFTIDNIGVAYVSTSFVPGVHVLTATYQPEPGVDTTQSVAVVVQIIDTPGSLSLAANPYYTILGSPVAFTITEQPSADGSFPSPVNLVNLRNNTVQAAVDIDPSTGIGTYTTTSLLVGYTAFQAVFGGGKSGSTFSNQISVRIASPTALTLASDLNPAQAFTPFNLTATFTGLATAPTTGFVTFNAILTQPGSFSRAIGRVNIANGPATLPVSLPAGTYNLTAFYGGDAVQAATISPPIGETVLGVTTTLTLTSALNPASAFQPVPLTAHVAGPTTAAAGTISGTVTFSSNGRSIGTSEVGTDGSATLNPNFAPGSYSLTASYSGNDSFASSTSGPVPESVGRSDTSTSLVPTPDPGYTPGQEAIRAIVSPGALSSSLAPAPTGTVAFYDGSSLIATTPFDGILNNSAQSDSSISNFSVGSHILTAVYSGDANYLPSTSDAVTLNVLVSDFSVATDPTLTIPTEQFKTLALSLASIGNFADTIAIACGNLPAFATCNFPGRGTKGLAILTAGAAQTVDIAIDTDALLNYTSTRYPAAHSQWRPGSFALALLFPVALLAARRRFKLPGRGKVPGLFAITFALLTIASLCGCGSGREPGHTPPGTYNITVTGTGAMSGRTHTANVILVVTK